MKKFVLFSLLIVLVYSFAAYAENIGVIAKAGISEEDFNAVIKNSWKWTVPEFADKYHYSYYDSLLSMMFALNRGDIYEVAVPCFVADYVVASNPELKVSRALHTASNFLAFGFLNDDKGRELQEKFNSVLSELKSNGKLDVLYHEYINLMQFKSVEFEKFDGAETIKAAITGDLPPIDFIASDGTPQGFNTALLAEIGRALKVNIELVEIDAIARTPALTSGRCDTVFWFMVESEKYDINENVILSVPYYSWDFFVAFNKREK